MMKFGLIGYPLSHSFSKRYFNEKFAREGLTDHSYELYPLEQVTQFPDLLRREPQLVGINVTIPYKQAILPFLDELSPGAAAIGAVNCIQRQGKFLKGYNTDVHGFQSSLERFIHHHRPEEQTAGLSALVLGTGGAAQAVKFALEQLSIPYQLISRSKKEDQLSYADLTADLIAQTPLLINTTPLGMAPNIEACPDLPYEAIGPQHLLYDLIYNPEKTLFLQRGEMAGAATLSGLEMLYGQAEKNWEIWNR